MNQIQMCHVVIYLCFISRPAEAEKFKLEKLAEAHRLKTVLEAEAEAEAVKVRGEVSNISLFYDLSNIMV